MSSHKHRASRWIVTSLFACLLALGTTSCANEQRSEDTAMSDRFITIEHAVNDPDSISIDIPDGWVDNSAAYRDDVTTQLSLKRTAGITGPTPGLWATRTSPHILSYTSDGDPLTVNLWAYRDSLLGESSLDEISDQKALPDRTIDGLPAPGKQYTYIPEDGTTYIIQTWYTLRRDGIWEIGIQSEPNSPDVPQELFDAIDTIHWTPPGDGTGTE